MFAEKSWGSYRVIDVETESMTLKVTLNPGHKMNYHSHEYRDESWNVISGTGRVIIDGKSRDIGPGDAIMISKGTKHTVIADTKLQLIEVQFGKDIDVNDKIKYELGK
jgi:mannose-1-phosphate guanylyltransferase